MTHPISRVANNTLTSLGMNFKYPWVTLGVKTPCRMTFPEHFLIVAGFCQKTHPNSVNSTGPSSMKRIHRQTSNFGSIFLELGSSYSYSASTKGKVKITVAEVGEKIGLKLCV